MARGPNPPRYTEFGHYRNFIRTLMKGCTTMLPHALATARLPRSGNAALASGAVIQALLGAEFVLAGLSKAIDPDFVTQFRTFVSTSPGARDGLLAGVMQTLVVPHANLIAGLTRWTELGAGLVLLVTALEVLRRR